MVGGRRAEFCSESIPCGRDGCRVVAGPVEATALGNIVMQMVASGAVDSIAKGREIVAQSFPAEVFEPHGAGRWDVLTRGSGSMFRQWKR